MAVEMDAENASEFWPLLDGSLPPSLFADEHLRSVLFEYLPLYYQCSAATIRQGVKAHLKRTAPGSPKPLGADQLVRDRNMASLFGNLPAARDRAGEIGFVAEEGYNKRGRNGTRGRLLPPVFSFAELIWTGYRKAPDMSLLYDWLVEAGEERPNLAGRTFLTAKSLTSAIAAEKCPVTLDNIWLSRSIVLFASLLPADECLQLLYTAANLGCRPVSEAYFNEDLATAVPTSVSTQGASEARSVVASLPRRPKLAAPELVSPGKYDISPETLQWLEALDAVTHDMRNARLAAEQALCQDATVALDGPAESWQAIVEAVDLSRRSTAALIDTVKLGSARQASMYDELDELLGTSFKDAFVAASIDHERLVAELTSLDTITNALHQVRPSIDLLSSWRMTIGSETLAVAGKRLVRAAEKEVARRNTENEFREDVLAYVTQQPTEEVTAFLGELNSMALAAVLPVFLDAPWIVGGAIIFRLLIDQGSDELDSPLSYVSTAPKLVRRAMLQFVDPASSSCDAYPSFRRIVALERFRDILMFGPLAQIGDPSSGLSDANLVGRSIHELIECISSNLDILDTGVDIIRMLRRPAEQAEAAKSLISYILAPATMSGTFRRLREQARELLLLPLLDATEINTVRAAALAGELNSGRAIDSVLGAFQSERPDDRIESRHREQLTRYLDQAGQLLKDYLAEASDQPDARQRSYRQELSIIQKRLRDDGDAATIEWLESEVRLILEGADQGLDHRTLVGDTTPIAEREWSATDRDWATSFIDLPEFHGPVAPKPLEIAASVMRWKGRGVVPSTRDIADYLVDRRAFSEALRLARERGDTIAQSAISTSAQPAVEAIEARARTILREAGEDVSAIDFDQDAFESALSRLDVDAASDLLDFWQLAILEREEQRANNLRDPEAGVRLQKTIARLNAAGVDTLDETMSLTELEAAWQDILLDRRAERAHLVEVASKLDPVSSILSSLTTPLSVFVGRCDDPQLWLEASVSSDFTLLVTEAVQKLATWIENSPNFRDEEQSALTKLSIWYLDFVIERSLSLHEQYVAEVLQSAFDRLLEVADTIIQAQRPSDCVSLLLESGELSAPPVEHLPVTTESSEAAQFDASDIPDALALPDLVSADVTALPEQLIAAIQAQDWSLAHEVCHSVAKTAGTTQAARLTAIGQAIDSLSDHATIPTAEVADIFPSAAAWLSNPRDGAADIGESKRTDIAFQLLSGAVAADSEQEMLRKSGAGGSWAEILGRASPFRRMLTTGLPSRTGRVLEALVSGPLALPVAERLWDAATNLSEPQTYRIPLLNLLNDHGAHEVIIKLAQRHEAAIVPRLSQLFEIRAVALNRPDLLPVSQSLAEHLAGQAKGAPFRMFIKNLPSASQTSQPTLRVSFDGSIQLRPPADKTGGLDLPIVVTPEGLVPAKLFARLFAEDDVIFADESRYKELSSNPIYFATDYAVNLRFGPSWFGPEAERRDSIRIRIEAKTVTDDLIVEDAVCTVRPVDRGRASSRVLNIDTLMDLYPGVANTPVVDDAFIGRFDEIENLHQFLVSAKNPSPVLLSGMRRVGKTSLLYAFHKRCSQVTGSGAISIYQTLAERKVELSSSEHTVAGVFFKTIQHGLVRPNLPADDRNHALCARIRQHFNNDWKEVRRAIQDCYDEDSLSSSLIMLVERLREWTGSQARFVFLLDEAEALVAPYQMGGRKRIELEQLLQSLREVSQTSTSIGILLSGSNHMNVFAREYKNAFFGSSQSIELEGFAEVETASQIVAPKGIESFVQFDSAAIEYAWSLCAGMPQFLWQIGATTALQVKSGPASRSDIRAAVATLVGADKSKLPFKAYEMLEPIDSMLSLETARERDLLWMLLYRVAQASSLALQDAAIPFVIDQALVAVDDRLAWRKRLGTLVDLKVLRMDTSSSVRFRVPFFAEGFRAPKNWQEFNIRQQQVAI
ncbi:hypothetical protein [Sphingomonas sp. LR55]|uniref:hypothetical protein n=1 Tax=Sphingomonas sp. LR55 TaxID=3050231 RepID=UPI002FE3A89B